MRRAFLAAAAVAVALTAAPVGAERRAMPVWSGTLPPPESVMGNDCNHAVVSGLRGDRRLRVRSGPGPGYPATGSLRAGTRIFVCNEASRGRENAGHEWLGVAFAGAGRPCTGATANGLDIRRSVRCRTGWVRSEWVTVR